MMSSPSSRSISSAVIGAAARIRAAAAPPAISATLLRQPVVRLQGAAASVGHQVLARLAPRLGEPVRKGEGQQGTGRQALARPGRLPARSSQPSAMRRMSSALFERSRRKRSMRSTKSCRRPGPSPRGRPQGPPSRACPASPATSTIRAKRGGSGAQAPARLRDPPGLVEGMQLLEKRPRLLQGRPGGGRGQSRRPRPPQAAQSRRSGARSADRIWPA